MNINITDITGRYPVQSRPLRGEKITVTVDEIAPGVFRVRFDGRANIDLWLEFTLEVRAEC